MAIIDRSMSEMCCSHDPNANARILEIFRNFARVTRLQDGRPVAKQSTVVDDAVARHQKDFSFTVETWAAMTFQP